MSVPTTGRGGWGWGPWPAGLEPWPRRQSVTRAIPAAASGPGKRLRGTASGAAPVEPPPARSLECPGARVEQPRDGHLRDRSSGPARPTGPGVIASRPGAAAAGLLLDRALGEPPGQLHPVAWFGRGMTRLEQQVWADSRAAGTVYTVVGAVIGAVAGGAAPPVLTSTVVVAGRELRRLARVVGDLAQRGDLDTARREVTSLVGRDPSELDASGIAAAVIESVAENSVDAVFAPALWTAAGGGAAAGAYRALNTMDAMVGHRSPRYARFGWAAARADDAANWIPARVFAVSVAVVRPRRARQVWQAVRHDAAAHPSPNAGVAEAAMAAALGRQLGGPLRYGDRHETRPRLGHGPRPCPIDVGEAVRVADHAERLLTAGLLAMAAVRWARR